MVRVEVHADYSYPNSNLVLILKLSTVSVVDTVEIVYLKVRVMQVVVHSIGTILSCIITWLMTVVIRLYITFQQVRS